MPSIPSASKMFFCRVTAPLNTDLMDRLPMVIKTKFYSHPIEFYYVHEEGLKTQKPHYHLLMICKTTKIEIIKYIKENFKVKGNEEYSVKDTYKPESKDMSLAYMLKGGLNDLIEFNIYKPGMVLCPLDAEDEMQFYVDTPKYNELIELYKKIRGLKEKEVDDKFESYMNLVKEKLCGNYGDINVIMSKLGYIDVLKKIYYILIRDAISKRKRIMRCLLWDWSFTLTLHIATPSEQNKLINRTIDEQIKKNLDILD